MLYNCTIVKNIIKSLYIPYYLEIRIRRSSMTPSVGLPFPCRGVHFLLSYKLIRAVFPLWDCVYPCAQVKSQ